MRCLLDSMVPNMLYIGIDIEDSMCLSSLLAASVEIMKIVL